MVMGLEKINWYYRRILFMVLTILSGAYFVGFTNDLFGSVLNPIFDFKLGLNFINGKNIIGLGLFYLTLALYHRQVE